MPGIDGVEAVRRLRARPDGHAIGVLVLTTFDQDEHVLAAVRAGADGFLGKDASPTELTNAVRRTADRHRSLSDRAAGALADHVAEGRGVPVEPNAVALLETLTAREREIVQAIVDGMPNTLIADQLHLSPFTVKTHANRAMAKVGATDRGQLVPIAVRAGVLPR